METSRRQVLTVAAATVTLPMLQAALGGMREAAAAARGGGQGGARGPGGQRGNQANQAPPEKPGWFTTTIKAANVKDDEFTAVTGHLGIVITRSGTTVSALTTKCTHRGCTVKPKEGANTITCPCHGAQYNLDGTVAKPPATQPLAHFAIRKNADGFIEIDPGTTTAATDKDYSITLA